MVIGAVLLIMMTMSMLIVALVMWVLLVFDGGNGGGSNGEQSGIADDDDGPTQMKTAIFLTSVRNTSIGLPLIVLWFKASKATSLSQQLPV